VSKSWMIRREPENMPSPEWHKDVLAAREKRIAEGSSRFVAWDEAKRFIRDQTR